VPVDGGQGAPENIAYGDWPLWLGIPARNVSCVKSLTPGHGSERIGPMVTEPLVDIVAVRAVGGYLLELAYPHGQVRLLDAEPLLSPRAYDAVRADHAAFAAVRGNPGGALVWPAAPGIGIPPGMVYLMSEPT